MTNGRSEGVGDGMTVGSEDLLLGSYLSAASEEEARTHLERLLSEVAGPLLDKVFARQLGGARSAVEPADIEDLRSATLLKLQMRLMAVRQGDLERPESLANYVAVAGYNAAAGFFMSRQPERTRLRDRVRYVLRRDDRLASWTGADRQTLCGLKRFLDAQAQPAAERLAEIAPAAAAEHGGGWGKFPGLVRAILTRLDSACGLEDLVDALAAALGVVEPLSGQPLGSAGSFGEGRMPQVADPGRSVLERLEADEQVMHLWREIKELPSNQRFALLVNLRGEGSEAPLEQFLLSGVAERDELADALGLGTQELIDLLPSLPRDDAWIAARLGLTRQQVINLRKSARLRLARRLRGVLGDLG